MEDASFLATKINGGLKLFATPSAITFQDQGEEPEVNGPAKVLGAINFAARAVVAFLFSSHKY